MVVVESTPLIRPVRLAWRVALILLLLSIDSPVASAGIGAPDLPLASGAGQPGTNAADPQWIRVAVVRNQPQVELTIHGRFRIVALHTAESLREGPRLSKVAVRAMPEGIGVGEHVFPLFGVRIEPAREATLTLNGQRLRGTLEILRQADVTLLVVNHVGLEDYLQGVLSKEAPHYWPMEALRALAIAARTYALFQRLAKTSVEYDVTSDVLSQLYGGKTAERRRTTRAVKDTAGLILTDGGRVFPTFYHSTCGGMTEHALVMGPFDLAPLRGGVACSFCRDSPFYRWQRRLTKADVAWAVKQRGRGSLWPVETVEIIEGTPTGRTAKIRIRGAQRSLELTGYEFRQLFGFDQIRSTAIMILPEPDGFLLDGHGWGHGVGLCQWGTAELARRGLFAHEILAFYYPTAQLVQLREIAVTPLISDDTRGRR